MLLAVAGVALDDSATTRVDLLSALQRRPQLARSVDHAGDPLAGMVVTPDGSRLVTYDRRGDLRSYSTTTWQTVADVDRSEDRIPLQWAAPLAVSPDGELIAAAPSGVGRDPVLLFDADSLEQARVQLGGMPKGPVRVIDFDFSANGEAVAAIVQRPEQERESGYWIPAAHELLVWDLTRNGPATAPVSLRAELPPPGNFRFPRVRLSPDGRTAYASQPLSAYDVASGTVLYKRSRILGVGGIRQTTSNVFDLNPAGTLLAATEPPDRLLLIDAGTGEVQRSLRGHDDQITALQFSHDGKSLASASLDRTAIIGRSARVSARTGACRRGRARPGLQP